MEIKLNAEQKEFVRRAVETGRARREEDAIRQALDLWVERERRREELLALIAEADASVARGETITLTKESIGPLVDDVKRRGRARLAAEKKRAHG
jgi:Arc/MetJ-type ribon-helix-helix transcriptional regulator